MCFWWVFYIWVRCCTAFFSLYHGNQVTRLSTNNYIDVQDWYFYEKTWNLKVGLRNNYTRIYLQKFPRLNCDSESISENLNFNNSQNCTFRISTYLFITLSEPDFIVFIIKPNQENHFVHHLLNLDILPPVNSTTETIITFIEKYIISFCRIKLH